ncbi:MAG: efflux RND transporter permease subunit, partial [bacterium]|nr:efflux RND transporter permease subunit [bacterium]
MSLPKFSVNNSKLINMIMMIVFIFGIYVMLDIPKEEMPAIEFGRFYINVTYRGVSPSEMEELVVKKIEDQIKNVNDIDNITSYCREGLAVINIDMLPNADIDQAWEDLNTELQKVRDLPDDAEDPILVRLNMREVNSICNVSIGGDFSEDSLRELAEDLQEELLNVENVSKVEISGTRDKEIWIEADMYKMDEFGISLNDLVNTINARNMNVPAGTIRFGKAEFIIRTVGEFETVDQIKELIIQMDSNGRAIKVRQIAKVSETLEERSLIDKLSGKPAVNIRVYQKAEGNIVKIMKDVRETVNDFEKRVEGLHVEIRNDGSIEVKNSLNTLGNNALLGVILVFITLTLFIGWRNAVFAAWGIPFSFLLTFILMQRFNVTMNNLSLFGLILVLGMVVDDAIIVLENIQRYREMGYSIKDATIKGTEEIMWPVVAAVATTIAAFLPMLMMEGRMGRFMSIFPIVVSLALLASLFECLIILPSHVAELGGKKVKKEEPNKLTLKFQEKYRKMARWALCHRPVIIVGIIIALIFSGAALAFKLVKFEFFPRHTVKTLTLKLQTPVGTNLDKTNEVISKVEEFIMTMPEHEDIEAMVTTVGQLRENHQWKVETSNAEVRIDFKDADEMKYSQDAIKNKIRKYLSELPGLYSYKFGESRGGPPTGDDIEIRVLGDDLGRLEAIGEYVMEELGKIPGVSDIESSFSPGKKEIQIFPYNDKIALYGLTVSNIARTVGIASYGTVVSKYRGTGLEEYNIVVKGNEDSFKNLSDIENLKIRTNKGELIPLKELAEFRITSGYSVIEQRDGKRLITITAATGVYNINGKTKRRNPDEVTEILMGNKLLKKEGV